MYARCIERRREDGIRLSICTSIHSAGGVEKKIIIDGPTDRLTELLSRSRQSRQRLLVVVVVTHV